MMTLLLEGMTAFISQVLPDTTAEKDKGCCMLSNISVVHQAVKWTISVGGTSDSAITGARNATSVV